MQHSLGYGVLCFRLTVRGRVVSTVWLQMFCRERDFNDKLLALREKKMNIVHKVALLDKEYDTIGELLQRPLPAPTDIGVSMDPQEFPDRHV